MKKPILIDNVEKGTSESQHFGFQSMIGCDVYSKKGVVRMGHDTLYSFNSVDNGSIITQLPVSFVTVPTGTYYAQLANGKVLKSTDSGATWAGVAAITGGTDAGAACGMIHYNGNDVSDGYLFIFRQTVVGVYNISANTYTADWKTGLLAGEYDVEGGSTSSFHFPFLFPNQSRLYFGNRNRLGYIGLGTAATFNPAGTLGTGYSYNAAILTLPGNYIINTLAFFPPSKLAMGCGSLVDDSISDIITWDTISTNLFDAPIRLYSNGQVAQNGIFQMINRNNLLYCVTGGHKVFITNGSTYSELADISLYTDLRSNGITRTGATGTPGMAGADTTTPVVLGQYWNAIAIVNGRIITGIATPHVVTMYPTSYGIYPAGVWSITVEGDEHVFAKQTKNIVCEYVPSYDDVDGDYFVPQHDFAIGALKTLSYNSYLVGWKKHGVYGIDVVAPYTYLNTLASGTYKYKAAIVETPLIQIGTNLKPETISNFEIQFTSNIDGPTIAIFYRTKTSVDYTLLQVIPTQNPVKDSYSVTVSDIGQTRFIQFAVLMYNTSGSVASPELKNILIT